MVNTLVHFASDSDAVFSAPQGQKPQETEVAGLAV